MGEYSSKINDLLDGYHEDIEDIQWMKDKIADLQGWSRRNNIKLRGIPESISPSRLLPYVKDRFSLLLSGQQEANLLVERIHHIFQSKHLPEETPRDVLLRVHIHIKEQLMKAAHQIGTLPEPYSAISFSLIFLRLRPNTENSFYPPHKS